MVRRTYSFPPGKFCFFVFFSEEIESGFFQQTHQLFSSTVTFRTFSNHDNRYALALTVVGGVIVA